jgi:hypothetical protein
MLAFMHRSDESSARDQARGVVFYETALACERAVEFCRHLTDDHSTAIDWYSFDALTEASSAARATRKASIADLLLFSMIFDGDLPREVKIWIEGLLAERHEREGAIIGLVLDRPQHVSVEVSPKEIYLRHTAKRAGMDYLSHGTPAQWNAMPDSIDSFNQRAGQMTSVLDQILRTPTVPPPRL